MSDRLKGKRAVVTAAAAGIGRACAIAFAREGATVIATDINESGIATLGKEGVAETAQLDVRSTAGVDAFAKRIGKIDILLNAAGFVHHGTIMDCSEEDWDFSFDLNVKSMHRTIKAFLPAMLAGGGGSIVNISSCAALRPPANRYVYSASKAAVSLLTRAVALDFITQGIRCNSIAPGPIDGTEGVKRLLPEGCREKMIESIPLQRLGSVEDIGNLCAYLCCPLSTYVTGTVIVADGGQNLLGSGYMTHIMMSAME